MPVDVTDPVLLEQLQRYGQARPTPQNPLLGALASGLGTATGYAARRDPTMPGGYANPVLAGLSSLLGLPAVQQTVERLSYGEPLTRGAGMTTALRPEAAEAALAVAPLAGPAARGTTAAARALAPKAGQMLEEQMLRQGLAIPVIKPKGGNWLTGSVESATEPLKTKSTAVSRELDNLLQEQANRGIEGARQMLAERESLNQWIDQKLNKYIKNEMGTPEDPVRKLAEQNILHFEPRGGAVRSYAHRSLAGMPTEPTATSPLARAWEDVTDAAVLPGAYAEHTPGGDLGAEALRKIGGEYAVKNPQAMAYTMDTGTTPSDLGFRHLVDELRNATRADSDLPARLRWKPEDLSKVTMEQAVKRVHDINEWRAAQKAEADAARAQNPATFLHKEYETVPGTAEPNEKGLRWVELKTPEFTSPEELSAEAQSKYQQYISAGADHETSMRRAIKHDESLSKALEYEGEVMGHCVGGYCPDVESGRSRIFSLRDKKGEPHVTVEVRPPNKAMMPYDYWYDRVGKDSPEVKEFLAWAQERKPARGDLGSMYEQWAKETGRPVEVPPSDIVQIKGKGNKAPKDEYLPFVQDFVKGGKWSRVGDLQNAGLSEVGGQYLTKQELKPLVEEASRFLNEHPALEPHRQAQRAYDAFRGDIPSAEYAELQHQAGRAVSPNIPYTWRELRSILDDPGAFSDRARGASDALGPNLERIARLRQELGALPPQGAAGYAGGGAVAPAAEVPTPSIFGVKPYAAKVAAEMYPGQLGTDDQRDAARHMLAAGTLARKYSPAVAEALGKLYEFSSAPLDSIMRLVRQTPDPADYVMDVHNNALGAQLGVQARSQRELEDLVQSAAERAARTRTPGQAYILKARGGRIAFEDPLRIERRHRLARNI